MPNVVSKKISGADKFQLLLDRHIMSGGSATGNVIRLSIEAKGQINAKELQKKIQQNDFLTQLNSLEIKEPFFSVPRWKQEKKQKTVSVSEHIAEKHGFFPEEILNRRLKINSGELLHIDIIHSPEHTTIVISAHHVLADNQGIQAIAKIISEDKEQNEIVFTDDEKNEPSLWKKLVHTLKSVVFVFRKTPKNLARLRENKKQNNKFSVIRFSNDESKKIEELALKNGAQLSRSAYFLAATSIALKQTVFANTEGNSFFVPVPQNQRLRGKKNFHLGNDISFLFYNIPFSELENLRNATSFITQQLTEQAKKESPKSYKYLMEVFRFLPLTVYDFFFKLPTKGTISSFLFSDLGETLPDMKIFLGKEISEILNFPPSPSPPGITIVFMKHTEKIKVITAYNISMISDAEIAKFEAVLRKLLL